MILVFTFRDEEGKECVDYGLNLDNDKFVVMPQVPVYFFEDIKWDSDLQSNVIYNK